MKMKKITLDQVIFGEEPTFNTKQEIGFIRSLSWYSGQFGPKESKNYLLDYLNECNYDKIIIKSLEKTPEECFSNIGFVARMLQRGLVLPEEKMLQLENKIKELSRQQKIKIQDQDEDLQTEEVNVQERIYEQANKYINVIEGVVDEFIKTKSSNFKCYDFLKSQNAKNVYTSHIKNYYLPLYNEIKEVLDGTDEQLNEAYSYTWSKRQIKKFFEFITTILKDCEDYSGNVKLTRKPRAKKPLTVEKQLKTLTYQKECIDLKLTSINPTNILGAKVLLVFNTRYNQLGLYQAKDDKGFGIKGTTLTNFDEHLSICKRIKRPIEAIESVKSLRKTQLNNWMNNLKSKPQSLTGRINDNTILLKTFI